MRTATGRLGLRVRPEVEQRLRAAAEVEHQPLSAFVLSAAEQRANEVLRELSVTLVPPEFFDHLLAALDEPAYPNPALMSATRRAQHVVKQR